MVGWNNAVVLNKRGASFFLFFCVLRVDKKEIELVCLGLLLGWQAMKAAVVGSCGRCHLEQHRHQHQYRGVFDQCGRLFVAVRGRVFGWRHSTQRSCLPFVCVSLVTTRTKDFHLMRRAQSAGRWGWPFAGYDRFHGDAILYQSFCHAAAVIGNGTGLVNSLDYPLISEVMHVRAAERLAQGGGGGVLTSQPLCVELSC